MAGQGLIAPKAVTVTERYDAIGAGYSTRRVADPRWVAAIGAALGPADSVINVGAGTGSYEPRSTVLALEPSQRMIDQRSATVPAVRGVAEALPARTAGVDAALAVLTLHHWSDWRRGVAELARVSRHRVVILTFDHDVHSRFWLIDEYVPAVRRLTQSLPSPGEIADALGRATVTPLPLAADFVDQVLPAHWRRPEAYLDPEVRAVCSGLALTDPADVAAGMARLADDLSSGSWQARHAGLLERTHYDAGFRLVVGQTNV